MTHRRLLLRAASLQVAVFILFFFHVLPLPVVSALGMLLALGVGVQLLRRHTPGPLTVGLVACLGSVVGWGSWIVVWWTHRSDLTGTDSPGNNLIFLAALIALPLCVGAAFLPRTALSTSTRSG